MTTISMLMIKYCNTTLDLSPCSFQGNHFDGVNTLCGDEHFWMVNQQNIPVAGVSLRRESGASDAGISTFGKCGMFKFKISDIRVLE